MTPGGAASGNGRRVVITGMGVISPLGNGVEELWRRALDGESGITELTAIDPSNYPCKVAGQVHDFDPTEWMDRKTARRMARFSQFAIAAGRQALDDAALDLESMDRERVGTVLGSGGGGVPDTERAMRTILERGGMKLDPLYVAKMLPNMAAGNLTIQLGLLGYTNTVTTACAAATQGDRRRVGGDPARGRGRDGRRRRGGGDLRAGTGRVLRDAGADDLLQRPAGGVVAAVRS